MINYKLKQIKKGISNKGYHIVRNFLDKDDFDKNFLSYLNKKKKFVDGVIHGINKKYYDKINLKIQIIAKELSNKNLNISKNKFCYSSIIIKKSIKNKPKLIKPFNIYKDPKIMPGGVLNWHVDHFTYYFHNDHKNYLICYMPILKSEPTKSNVAIIPYNVLRRKDIDTFRKIKDRGAVRFRKVEKDTKPWFDMRFKEETKINDWYALDDYNDNSQGWKLNVDLEKIKVVPKLNLYDLLIMKADVIHKTNDAKINRIAIRCDILPKNSLYEQSLLGFFSICLKYLFQTKKVKYNLKKYIKKYIS